MSINKSKYISVRVTPNQKKMVQATATKLGISMNDVYRMGFLKIINSTLTVSEIEEIIKGSQSQAG